jgi:hypothetical protein
MPKQIPRHAAPADMVRAWDRLMQTDQATKGKPWNDPAWTEHETAREAYRAACRKAGYTPAKGRAGIANYPHIAPPVDNFVNK